MGVGLNVLLLTWHDGLSALFSLHSLVIQTHLLDCIYKTFGHVIKFSIFLKSSQHLKRVIHERQVKTQCTIGSFLTQCERYTFIAVFRYTTALFERDTEP